jgi:hypothetical protein
MSLKKILSIFSSKPQPPATPAAGRGYAFGGTGDWEDVGEAGSFRMMSPDADGMLFEISLKEQPRSEPLEEANERVNFFNNRVEEGQQGRPRKVFGPGWEGLLQSQYTRQGGHEFQLVVKTGRNTLVFYLGSPPGLEQDGLKKLELVILSLTVDG